MKKILLFMLLFSTFIFAQRRTMVDVGNSSTTALDSSATFTGVANDVVYNGRWSSVSVAVYVDHVDSVMSNTLNVKFGTDGSTWAETNTYTITDSVEYNFVFPLRYQWYQVTLANDTAAMTTLRLESVLYEEDMSISKTLEDSTITVSISGATNSGDALNVSDDSTHTNTATIIDRLDSTITVLNDTTLATSETNSTAIKTAVEIMDNVVDDDLDVNRVANLSPEWARYTAGSLDISEADLDTDSSFAIIDMNGYSYFSVHANASGGVTMKAYITNNASASNTDSDDGNWSDYSTVLLGGASVADPTNLFYVQDTPLTCEKVMIKMVTADATNAIAVRTKRSR